MGLLNRGLSAAGYGVAQLGLDGFRASLEQDKIRLADQLAGARESASDTRREDIRREGRLSDINQDTDPAIIAKKGAAASGLINATTEAEANKRKKFGEVDTKIAVDQFEKLAPLQRKEAIDAAAAQVKALATPEMLKASRDIALSKHIVDPSYILIPNLDGTVTTFDSKSGKSGGVLTGTDGKPVIRNDPEELRAAVSVINMANTNLKIAQAAYKAAESDITADPSAKAAAAAEWKAAREEAKRLTAPAYAVLYKKANIEVPESTEKPEKSGAPAVGTVVGGHEFTGGDPNNKANWKAVEKKTTGKTGSQDTPPPRVEGGGGYQPVGAQEYVAAHGGNDEIASIEAALRSPNLTTEQKSALSLQLQEAMRKSGKLGK
jgi:hypothetical protein